VRRLLTACVLVALVAVPVAAASVFDGTLELSGTQSPALILGDPSCVGVAAGLLADRFDERRDAFQARSFHSPLKEGAASFLLPGLGQLRMGRALRSKIFFGLEGATWVAIGSFLWQGYARENAYRDYAEAFAGISGTSHSDEYYETIGKYMSNEGPGGYNEYVRREARDLYYPDIDAMNAYYADNSIVGAYSWRWESEKTFSLYNDLRDGSRSSYRRALYAGFFALALRVVSAVDAVRLARGSAGDGNNGGKSVSMSIKHQHDGFRISFTKSF
jgi:hypothetical protein